MKNLFTEETRKTTLAIALSVAYAACVTYAAKEFASDLYLADQAVALIIGITIVLTIVMSFSKVALIKYLPAVFAGIYFTAEVITSIMNMFTV